MLCVVTFILLLVPETASVDTSIIFSKYTESGEQTMDLCHIDIDENSLEAARELFQQSLKDSDLINIYLCQTDNCEKENISMLTSDEQCDRNRIQQWIWIKEDNVYQGLKFPIDLDTITFTLSSIKTKDILIKFNFSNSCNSTSEINQTETEGLLAKTLHSDVTGNISNSLLCHRACKHTDKGIDVAWRITTVWIGYGFDCFYLNDGTLNPTHISKYDNTIILTYVLCILAYMHPFLLQIFEGNQVAEESLNKYYRKNIHTDTPYSINRLIQKLIFGPICGRSCFSVSRFYFFLAIIAFSLSVYQLVIYSTIHSLWESAEHDFPDIYRYTSIEYRNSFTVESARYIHVIFDALSLLCCNFVFYIVFNEGNDFIIAFPNICFKKCKCIEYCKAFIVPINTILNPMANEPEGLTETKNKPFIVAEKLMIRFTLLFSPRFWKRMYTHSFCERTRCCSSCCCSCSCSCCLMTCVGCVFGAVVFVANVIINVIFCTLPALWLLIFTILSLRKNVDRKLFCVTVMFLVIYYILFLDLIFFSPDISTTIVSVIFGIVIVFISLYIIYTLIRLCCFDQKGSEKNSNTETFNSLDQEGSKKNSNTETFNYFDKVFFIIIYMFSFRGQISYFLFILRAVTYTILIAFTTTDHVLKIYMTVLSTVVYFLTFIKQFVRSYTLLLEKMFEIRDKNNPQNKSEIDEDLFDYVVENCFSVRKRVFFLVIKTVITFVFFMVTIFILVDTNKLEYLNTNDSLTLLFIFITPKLIEVFADNDPKIDIDNHEEQIKELIENYRKTNDPCDWVCCKNVDDPNAIEEHDQSSVDKNATCFLGCCCKNTDDTNGIEENENGHSNDDENNISSESNPLLGHHSNHEGSIN